MVYDLGKIVFYIEIKRVSIAVDALFFIGFLGEKCYFYQKSSVMSGENRITKQEIINQKARARLQRAYSSIVDGIVLVESNGIDMSDFREFFIKCEKHVQESGDIVKLTEMTIEFADKKMREQDESTI